MSVARVVRPWDAKYIQRVPKGRHIKFPQIILHAAPSGLIKKYNILFPGLTAGATDISPLRGLLIIDYSLFSALSYLRILFHLMHSVASDF